MESPAVRQPIVVRSSAPKVTVVDVAPGVPASTVVSLVRIGPGERIASVDDREVGSELVAGLELADAIRGGAHYVDLAVASREVPDHVRRVLVLLH